MEETDKNIEKFDAKTNVSIQARYDCWQLQRQEFSYPEFANSRSHLDFPSYNVAEMGQFADISELMPIPLFGPPSLRPLLKVILPRVNRVLTKLAKPFIKVFFNRQIQFNSKVKNMAQSLLAMESRIFELEAKVRALEGPQRSDK